METAAGSILSVLLIVIIVLLILGVIALILFSIIENSNQPHIWSAAVVSDSMHLWHNGRREEQV